MSEQIQAQHDQDILTSPRTVSKHQIKIGTLPHVPGAQTLVKVVGLAEGPTEGFDIADIPARPARMHSQ